MAISSPGVGSSLDVNSIVSQLMSLERQPVTRLQAQQTKVNNQISALGRVKSAIDALKTASEGISTASDLYSYKATVADATVASATTTSKAVGGTYSLDIKQLASYHKLLSAAGADASAGGTLTIEIGSGSGAGFVRKTGTSAIAVTIDAGSSLATVASAINSTNDVGVTATVVNGAGGAQLVITSKDSGAANQIKITPSSAALDDFAYNTGNVLYPNTLSEKDAGQDAILKIDGITIANTSSNIVTDAITGVTLTLLKVNDATPLTEDNLTPTALTIANESANLKTKAEAFVKAYNDVRTLLKDLSKYDSTGKTTGALNGDSTVNSIMGQLRSALSTVPSAASSNYQYLADLGISSQSDGSLKLDASKLQTAMDSNFSAVASTLAAYGTVFDTLTTEMNNTDGLITSRTNGLNSSYKLFGTRIEDINIRLVTVEKRYRAQFTALDSMMGRFQTTSSYLSQQLSSLSR